jgi:hypothetical protein
MTQRTRPNDCSQLQLEQDLWFLHVALGLAMFLVDEKLLW